MSEAAILVRSADMPKWAHPLARYLQKCAAMQCPARGKLWPAWLRKTPGIEFRKKWYCCAACAQHAVDREIELLTRGLATERPRPHRFSLGLLLVSRGVINRAQLLEALRLQKEAGSGKLGAWLRHIGAINESDLASALSVQWNCPIFPLDGHYAPLSFPAIPNCLLESARILPVHYSRENHALHVVFAVRIDHTLIYSLEQMLGCKVVPCVTHESAFEAGLAKARLLARPCETTFDTVRDQREIAATIVNYATKLAADRIQMSVTAGYIWARFTSGTLAHDLLFQVGPLAGSAA